MRIADVLLLAFDIEMKMTQSYFEAFPEDKAGWKPHEKSTSLGQTAKHIAMLPAFGTLFLESDFMDVTGPPKTPEFVSKADLFSTLNETSAKFRSVLAEAGDEFLMQEWSFRKDGKVFSAAPRASMVKVMFFHHFIHHRAQLGVYLRLLDVSVPGIYGPSADAGWEPEKLGLV
jgi:uncharacterized damage-inducible protein DinB